MFPDISRYVLLFSDIVVMYFLVSCLKSLHIAMCVTWVGEVRGRFPRDHLRNAQKLKLNSAWVGLQIVSMLPDLEDVLHQEDAGWPDLCFVSREDSTLFWTVLHLIHISIICVYIIEYGT